MKICRSAPTFATCPRPGLLLAAQSLLCQLEQGSITGTVIDSSGAVVPAAEVTLMDTSTQVRRSATTNNSGSYVFPYLTPGQYQVTVASRLRNRGGGRHRNRPSASRRRLTPRWLLEHNRQQVTVLRARSNWSSRVRLWVRLFPETNAGTSGSRAESFHPGSYGARRGAGEQCRQSDYRDRERRANVFDGPSDGRCRSPQQHW